MPLTDLIDFLALINSAVNFGMYCVMSQQFRNTLTASINDSVKSLKVCSKAADRNHYNHTPSTTLTHV
jgi:hypothetical protein